MQSVTAHRDRSGGQSLVEFALVAPLFFLILFGVIQMGILFGGQLALTNTAREVARYASTVPAGATVGQIQSQANPILQRSVPAYNASAATVGVSYCYYTNPTTPTTWSQKVTISIRYGHTLFIPLVGALIDRIDGVADNKFTTDVREEMKVEAQPLKSVPSGTDCGANP